MLNRVLSGLGIAVALVSKHIAGHGEAAPFVMELPNYRMPGVRSVVQLLWEKAKDFLHRAFSVILIATIAVWFLKSFDFRLNLVADSHESILAAAAVTGAATVILAMGAGKKAAAAILEDHPS